jgi:hypothetical protein
VFSRSLEGGMVWVKPLPIGIEQGGAVPVFEAL